MAQHAVIETDEPIGAVERLKIEAHFASHGIDLLILPPGVRVAVMADDQEPIEFQD